MLCQRRGFFNRREEITYYSAIGRDELSTDSLHRILSGCLPRLGCLQADFEMPSLDGLLCIILAGFILFAEERPNELPSPLIKVVEGV